MKKFKNILCLTLAISLCLSLVIPAFATDEINAEPDALSELRSDEIMDRMAKISTPYTIEFERSVVPQTYAANNVEDVSIDAAEKAVNKAHNEEAVRQAEELLFSLDLSESGYGFIEEACLQELNYYKEQDEVQLLSYTIFAPNENYETAVLASTPSDSDLFYFGTYNSKDFYFYYPSMAEVQSKIVKQTSTSSIQKWVSGIVNFFAQFGSIEVQFAWQLFQNQLNVAGKYEVHDSAFLESYCILQMHTRYIYGKGGNNNNILLSSQQFCEVYPYTVLHTGNTSKPTVTVNYGYAGQAFSTKFNNGTAKLCQEAWQIFYGSVVLDRFNDLKVDQLKTFFK